MPDWEAIAQELLWAHSLDKADRVDELETIVAIDVRDGNEPSRGDVKRLRAAIDDRESSLDGRVEPLVETTREEVDVRIRGQHRG